MESALKLPTVANRRPGPLDFTAGALLVAAVALHVVALFPDYFVNNGSLAGQPDQATQYAVLAGAWALALFIGLLGPHRLPAAAALAMGVAAGELGFRLFDLGYAFLHGATAVGAGLWIMEAGWVAGAAAAVFASAAVRARVRLAGAPAVPPGEAVPPTSLSVPDMNIDWAALPEPATPNPYSEMAYPEVGTHPPRSPAPAAQTASTFPVPELSDPVSEPPPDPTAAVPASDPTAGIPAPEPTAAIPSDPTALVAVAPGAPSRRRRPDRPLTDEEAHERMAWTALVVVLSLIVAGAFLPAWDHFVVYSSVSGQSVTHDSGNVFNYPWQEIIGNVLVAVALVAIPVLGIRLRDKAVGAALAIGSLLPLAAQLVGAVVQVDEPVPLSDLGLSPSQADQLGIQVGLRLTGWYTLEALAVYALFAAVMVWATLRLVHEGSSHANRANPEFRRQAIPWAS